MLGLKDKKQRVFVMKLAAISIAAIFTASLAYYAPRVPPFLKLFFPAEMRWSEAEIIEQVRTKTVDKGYLAYYNRDPERTAPHEKNILVAPADGTVKVIRSVNGRQRIVIYLSFWDIHVQRVPLSGTVTAVVDSMHKDQDDFKCENCYQKITEIDTEMGPITVKQVTSAFSSRIRSFLKEGQKVAIAERLGSILLGSHVVLETPPTLKVCVKKGDKVYGGETIIGRY